MSATTAPTTTRRYRRLLPAQEAELRALWEAGASTADDLAVRFGMSRRGIQAALKRLGSVKGSAAAAVSKAVHARILSDAMPEHPDLASQIRWTRDETYRNATRIEALAMAAAEGIASGEVASAATIVRALDGIASILSRTRTARFVALGLDPRGSVHDGDPPELTVREMTEAEAADMRRQQEEEDRVIRAGATVQPDDAEQAPASAEQDDVIEEGEPA